MTYDILEEIFNFWIRIENFATLYPTYTVIIATALIWLPTNAIIKIFKI